MLAASLAAPSAAQTPAEQARLASIHSRGALLYLIDRAGWVTTDDLRSKAALRGDKSLRGYVVERSPEGFTVTLFAEERGRLVRAYVANVARNRVASSQVLAPGERTQLTPIQIRLAKARQLPAGLDIRPCSGPFNVTAIPPTTAETPMDVYYLSPQVKTGEYPFGGHFRVTLARDGRVLASRKFSNACLNMPAPPTSAFLGVSHILDPIPTEIHVFNALAARKPVLVITGERTWKVDGRSITLLEPRK